jgi:hypothetical protein
MSLPALLAGKWNDFLSCDSDWIGLSRRNWRIQDMTRTPAQTSTNFSQFQVVQRLSSGV